MMTLYRPSKRPPPLLRAAESMEICANLLPPASDLSCKVEDFVQNSRVVEMGTSFGFCDMAFGFANRVVWIGPLEYWSGLVWVIWTGVLWALKVLVHVPPIVGLRIFFFWV